LELRASAQDPNRSDKEDLDQSRSSDRSTSTGNQSQDLMPLEQTINPSALDSATKRVIEGNEI